jgi:hypothetical protein
MEDQERGSVKDIKAGEVKRSFMTEIKLPPLPRLQVPRIDADVDLMDIRRLVKWAECIANAHAHAAVEADRKNRGDLGES